jgi:hypothetical protein
VFGRRGSDGFDGRFRKKLPCEPLRVEWLQWVMNVDLGAAYTATRTGGKRKLVCSSGRCSAGTAKQLQHVVGSLDDLALAVDPAVDLIALLHLGENVRDGRVRHTKAVGQMLRPLVMVRSGVQSSLAAPVVSNHSGRARRIEGFIPAPSEF